MRVPRVVTAHGVGTILNEKTARSQIIGGVVWGIGMALLEETHDRSAHGALRERAISPSITCR